jgi:cytochrome c-type biogenesis protein CcmF
MWLAHFGIAVFIIGVTLVSNRGTETDIRLATGGVYETAGHRFQFNGVNVVKGPNYTAFRGEFVVYQGENEITRLYPEKRKYISGGMPMTEAGIDAGFLRDIYISLGEPIGMSGDWALRLYYKPFVRWIWLGCILMALGGVLTVTDRRYRSNCPATV